MFIVQVLKHLLHLWKMLFLVALRGQPKGGEVVFVFMACHPNQTLILIWGLEKKVI